ncbi:MAG: ABC transporter permease subunit [Oscillospiraceae bacterium]|jgi:putative aldouronate transport system permease protein|nr:ABC transporter permease subunit [Oscillospiraceae bacterium]
MSTQENRIEPVESIEIEKMLPGGQRSGKKRRKTAFERHAGRYGQLYFMLLVPIVYYVIFRYMPMAGNIIAFRKFSAGGSIFGDQWKGLYYFETFIFGPSGWKGFEKFITYLGISGFWRAFRNTLTLNFSYLVIRFPLTLIFALLLNEIRNLRWKKFVQTVSYLPHFIAVVIVAGMVKEVLSTSGPINGFIKSIGMEAIPFISEKDWFVTIFVTSGLWQSLGWGTILYLASISHINPALYEAAEVDGATHFQRVLHITIPSILPTITTLLILDIGGLVGSGMAFEKVFLLYTSATYETSDIISTYVYRMGIGPDSRGQFSNATAIGLFEGVINMTLLTIANFSSKKITGSSLW